VIVLGVLVAVGFEVLRRETAVEQTTPGRPTRHEHALAGQQVLSGDERP
jgi:hypothetical protein